jgi:hypothetical protein
MVPAWIPLLLIGLIIVGGCGVLAHRLGRNEGAWIALGMLFGPVALAVLILLSRRDPEQPPDYRLGLDDNQPKVKS